ncbi:MAG: hypothetical protein ACRD6I_17480, partial [Candidatus Acidiferrales bacterium]
MLRARPSHFRSSTARAPVARRADHPPAAFHPLIRNTRRQLNSIENPSSDARTGGLRSTPDFAAASRGKNLYFVMRLVLR